MDLVHEQQCSHRQRFWSDSSCRLDGAALGDFNSDGYPDYLLFNANTGGTVVWYMRNNVRIGAASGPTLPAGRSLAGVADFNGDTHPDYLLFNAATRGTVIWYMSGVTRTGSRNGPTIPAGFEVAGLADFDGNGSPDYLLYNSSTRQTAVWYMNNNLLIGNAAGPTICGRLERSSRLTRIDQRIQTVAMRDCANESALLQTCRRRYTAIVVA